MTDDEQHKQIRHTNSDLAVRGLIHADADPKAAAPVLQKLADWYAEIADAQANGEQERLEQKGDTEPRCSDCGEPVGSEVFYASGAFSSA